MIFPLVIIVKTIWGIVGFGVFAEIIREVRAIRKNKQKIGLRRLVSLGSASIFALIVIAWLNHSYFEEMWSGARYVFTSLLNHPDPHAAASDPVQTPAGTIPARTEPPTNAYSALYDAWSRYRESYWQKEGDERKRVIDAMATFEKSNGAALTLTQQEQVDLIRKFAAAWQTGNQGDWDRIVLQYKGDAPIQNLALNERDRIVSAPKNLNPCSSEAALASAKTGGYRAFKDYASSCASPSDTLFKQQILVFEAFFRDFRNSNDVLNMDDAGRAAVERAVAFVGRAYTEAWPEESTPPGGWTKKAAQFRIAYLVSEGIAFATSNKCVAAEKSVSKVGSILHNSKFDVSINAPHTGVDLDVQRKELTLLDESNRCNARDSPRREAICTGKADVIGLTDSYVRSQFVAKCDLELLKHIFE